MRKTGSWPNLQTTSLKPQITTNTKNSIPGLIPTSQRINKSPSALPLASIDGIVENITVFPTEVFHRVTSTSSITGSTSDSMDMDDSPINSFELSMIIKAPPHHVGLCMLDSPTVSLDKVLKKSVLELTEEDKSLASCIATPCEAAEECNIVEGIRRNFYIVANDNKNTELMQRLRKWKRRRGKGRIL